MESRQCQLQVHSDSFLFPSLSKNWKIKI